MAMNLQSGWLTHVFKGRSQPHLGPISQAERERRRKRYERETEGYEFERDWFSGNLRRFEYFLSPLKGSDCQLLEIGTHEGRAAVWLMDNVAISDGSRLTCVDIIEQPSWRANIEATGGAHRVEFRRGKSGDVLRNLPQNHFDFVYVDGY
ncbi:MAG TPA: class I SAM-dependent methyltransferase, partial [Candidatus Saccharimonadales bacterium]|nr:class I SAM-dependent methyltransferase [Candidatus Saccharimonadales bacterium]